MSIVPLLLMIYLANKTYGFNYTTYDIQKNDSFWIIGNRAPGDELLVNDTLITSRKNTLIKFSYAVTNAVTCLKIWSESNLNAVTDFYYGNDLITGKIIIKWLDQSSAIDSNRSLTLPLKIHINIFGFNNTNAQNINEQKQQQQEQQQHDNNNNNNNHILRHKWHYDGMLLQKINSSRDNHNVKVRHVDEINEMSENFDATTYRNKMNYSEIEDEAELDEYGNENYNEENDDEMDEDADDEDSDNDYDDIADDNDDYGFNQLLDKTIELGQRQNDDYLLYETYQTAPDGSQLISTPSDTLSSATPGMTDILTSMQSSVKATTKVKTEASATVAMNQSVVFYYIDSNFITYVKFIIYDHFVNNQPTSKDYMPPLAECTHLSSRSLKAIITDHQIGNLFVQMQIYGYQPKDLPVDYLGFMPNISMSTFINNPSNSNKNNNNNRNGDRNKDKNKDDSDIDDNDSAIIVIDANREAMTPIKKLQFLLKSQQEQHQQQQQQLDEYIQGHENSGQVETTRTNIDVNYNGLCNEQYSLPSLSSSSSSSSVATPTATTFTVINIKYFNIYSYISIYTLLMAITKCSNKLF